MEKYNLSMRVMHWLMAVLILTLLAVGLYMTNLPADDPSRATIYQMHKAFGMIALLLVVIRVCIRLGSYIPGLPSLINRRDTILHHITVVLLYIAMFVIPLAGYIMSEASGRQVNVFGLAIPSLFAPDPALAGIAHTIHVKGWYFLALFILLHLAGNAKHYLVEKVNLLSRMW